MKKSAQHKKKSVKKPIPPIPHFSPRTRDYGLAATNIRHNPSSGFSHSDAELYRDERSLNPNVRYVPDENNRDEFRQWSQSARGSTHNDHMRRPSLSSQRPDEYIYDYVHEILSRHPDIDVSQIDLNVQDGIVMLYGLVETRRLKRLIEDVVIGLPGIHDVQNRIEVQRHDPDRRRIAHSLA